MVEKFHDTNSQVINNQEVNKAIRDITNPYYLFWLGGFVEGEGSNTVTINVSENFKYGVDIKPEFNVSQHVNGIGILNSFKDLFKAGSVVPKSGSSDIFVYKLRGYNNMLNLVIPFLQRYVQPYSGKVNEFNLFLEITSRCAQGHNVDKANLIAMLELIYASGKLGKGKERKRTLPELLEIINDKEGYFSKLHSTRH